MKEIEILKIAGQLSPEGCFVKVVKMKAVKTNKLYKLVRHLFYEKQINQDKLKHIDTMLRNSISGEHDVIAFHTYCLPEDEKEMVKKIHIALETKMMEISKSAKEMNTQMLSCQMKYMDETQSTDKFNIKA